MAVERPDEILGAAGGGDGEGGGGGAARGDAGVGLAGERAHQRREIAALTLGDVVGLAGGVGDARDDAGRQPQRGQREQGRQPGGLPAQAGGRRGEGGLRVGEGLGAGVQRAEQVGEHDEAVDLAEQGGDSASRVAAT